MNETTHVYKYEITLRKHLPSGKQYVPADVISATARWNPGNGLSFDEVFKGLNQATEQAIRAWLNPAIAAITPETHRAEPTPTRVELKPPAEGDIDRLGWKAFKEGHSAGWIFRNLDDPIAKQLDAYLQAQEKLPVTIGKNRFRYSGPEDNPRMFISRAPVEKILSRKYGATPARQPDRSKPQLPTPSGRGDLNYQILRAQR